MAKRELSSTLRNLKFMQRAVHRDEKSKKKEDDTRPDGNFFAPSTASRKCVVILEGDPHPGAVKGRMSFQSCNPLIDRIYDEAPNLGQSEGPTTCNAQAAYFRENGTSLEGAGCLDMDKETHEANGNLKRKQAKAVGEEQYPIKSPRNGQSFENTLPSNSRSSRKQSKHEKLDWSVLRPSKGQQSKG